MENGSKQKIAIGSDHAGYEYKTSIVQWLHQNEYDVLDVHWIIPAF